ncbi:MBL fold metallo-hydrolase [Bacteriovoracales bacterium]|nr:MBL fold metallo-hydrolase [Bacteriovoracales bacterium]
MIYWVISLLIFVNLSCQNKVEKKIPQDVKIKEQNKQFRKGVYKVTDGVYVAVGYGLANSILVLGPKGKIIIDVLGNIETAKIVKKEFDKISKLPLKGIIYTHNHSDHIFGGEVFAEGKKIPVYAHEKTKKAINRIISVVEQSITARSFRMFGTYLNKEQLGNAGIGPFLEINSKSKLGLLYPTHTFSKRLKIKLAGLDVEMVHAPGETDDQIFIYLPQKKVLFPGDNYYHTFPNLYTIRGTPYRDVRLWANSLDLMMEKEPEFLVPSHTMPLKGKENIKDVLSHYRDAIRYVHDQTVRGMNSGLTPDELVQKVKLPKFLSEKPYLQEIYGRVDWAVRSIFSGYMGWFSGQSKDLYSSKKRGLYFSELVGGKDNLIFKANEAFKKGRSLWALELVEVFLKQWPEEIQGKRLRKKILEKLAEKELNVNSRHYFLTQALEVEKGALPYKRAIPSLKMVHSLDTELIFELFTVNFNAEKAQDIEKKVVFEFVDTNEVFTLFVKRGVASYKKKLLAPYDIHVKCNSKVFKEILAQKTNPLKALVKFSYPKGNAFSFSQFLTLFKPPQYKN